MEALLASKRYRLKVVSGLLRRLGELERFAERHRFDDVQAAASQMSERIIQEVGGLSLEVEDLEKLLPGQPEVDALTQPHGEEAQADRVQDGAVDQRVLRDAARRAHLVGGVPAAADEQEAEAAVDLEGLGGKPGDR